MNIGETTSAILGFAVWRNISTPAQLGCSKRPKLYTNNKLRDVLRMNLNNPISEVRNNVFGQL
jgi:hypothetical protein